MPALEKLRQRTLENAGRHAQYRNQPHPEQGARSAQGNGHCNTRNIAAAHPSGNADHQCLKTGNTALCAGKTTAAQLREHGAEQAQLNKAGSDGGAQSHHQQGPNQDVGPQPVRECCQHVRCSEQTGDKDNPNRGHRQVAHQYPPQCVCGVIRPKLVLTVAAQHKPACKRRNQQSPQGE